MRSTLRVCRRTTSPRAAPGASILHEQKAIAVPAAVDRRSAARAGRPAETGPSIVVAGADGMAAIGVDRLLGTAQDRRAPAAASA